MWANYEDVKAQIERRGIVIGKDGLIVGGDGFQRLAVVGKKGKPGWYKLFPHPTRCDIICGCFGIYEGNDTNSEKVVFDRQTAKVLTDDERKAVRYRIEADKKRAAAAQMASYERYAAKAASWWKQCRTSGESEYLERKGIDAGRLFGARLSPSGNLIVPAYDAAGKIWALQAILSDPVAKKKRDTDKVFTPGGVSVSGKFFILGAISTGCVVLICEGFATGVTLYLATGLPVVVAFTAGNLMPVSKNISAHYRGLRFLFCADDDYDWKQNGKKNAGLESAKLSALAVGGHVAIPIFPGDRPVITHKGPTDYNDLHTHPLGGLHAVRTQIEASLSACGWSSPRKPARAEIDNEGGGADELRSNLTIEEARDRWALIYGAKDTLYDFVDCTLVPKSNVIDLLQDHGWREWKRSGMIVHRISEVGFDPTGRDESVKCNLWSGWPTTPKQGCCTALLDLLRYLCSEEPSGDDIYRWILRWLAYPIQHPGAKMQTTVVCHGPMGTGKNLFFEAIMSIYGQYGRIIDQSAIEDKFNDWASRKLFLIADEVVARSGLWHIKNMLKGFITGRWIRINPKQVAAHDERNHVNMVMLTNDGLPTIIETGDRRYLVIWTPEKRSHEFYERVRKEIDNGGVAALHHYLLHLPLGDFGPHSKPPMTKAKEAVMSLSMGSIERFCREWLSGETRYPVCPCASAQIFSAYRTWCSSGGEKPRSQNELSGHLAKVNGFVVTPKHLYETSHYSGGTKKRRMVIPPENLLFRPEVNAADHRKPACKTESQWLTDCYYTFSDLIGTGDE